MKLRLFIAEIINISGMNEAAGALIALMDGEGEGEGKGEEQGEEEGEREGESDKCVWNRRMRRRGETRCRPCMHILNPLCLSTLVPSSTSYPFTWNTHYFFGR